MDSTNLNMKGLDLQQATVCPAGGVGVHSLHLRLHDYNTNVIYGTEKKDKKAVLSSVGDP
jgi:hypothetical protein